MPYLSIVVPVYNGALIISKCLESILIQNIPPEEFEIICVDDCSTDNTIEVLERFQKQHINLRIEKNPVNLRAGGARNNGVIAAQGDYVAFIDADDYYHPGSLKRVFEHLKKNPDLDILTCNFARELPEHPNKTFVHRYYSERKLTPTEYISANHFVPCSPWQWIFLRSLMIENNVFFREHTICEDVDWTHRLILMAKTIQYQPILLSHYVIDVGSQTALSYARAANVYAYMNAGRELCKLLPEYQKIGHENFIRGVAAGYVQQSLKYYLAMKDSVGNKIRNIQEIPTELSLNGRWELCRKHPLLYSCFTSIVYPFVKLALKIKSRFFFRGIKLN